MADRDLHRSVGGSPIAVAVVLHPHPAMGGDRHHPLVVAIAEGLATTGRTALRVDLTDPDPAVSAARLVEIAEELASDEGVDRIDLVGYSWGSVVSLLAAPVGLASRVLVAPPVSMLSVDIGKPSVPQLVLVPTHDQFGPAEAVQELMGEWSDTAIEIVEGCDHFLMGAVARITERSVSWLG
jgi:alpha/beta superfamily hydrolase